MRLNTIFYHLVVAYFFGPPCIYGLLLRHQELYNTDFTDKLNQLPTDYHF